MSSLVAQQHMNLFLAYNTSKVQGSKKLQSQAVTLLSTAETKLRIMHVRLAQQTYHHGKEDHYYDWKCIARDSENQLC